MKYTKNFIEKISNLFTAIILQETKKICGVKIAEDYSELIIGFLAYANASDFNDQVDSVKNYIEINYNLKPKDDQTQISSDKEFQRRNITFYFSEQQFDKIVGYFKTVYNMRAHYV